LDSSSICGLPVVEVVPTAATGTALTIVDVRFIMRRRTDTPMTKIMSRSTTTTSTMMMGVLPSLDEEEPDCPWRTDVGVTDDDDDDDVDTATVVTLGLDTAVTAMPAAPAATSRDVMTATSAENWSTA